jgi:hypothetical protein
MFIQGASLIDVSFFPFIPVQTAVIDSVCGYHSEH